MDHTTTTTTSSSDGNGLMGVAHSPLTPLRRRVFAATTTVLLYATSIPLANAFSAGPHHSLTPTSRFSSTTPAVGTSLQMAEPATLELIQNSRKAKASRLIFGGKNGGSVSVVESPELSMSDTNIKIGSLLQEDAYAANDTLTRGRQSTRVTDSQSNASYLNSVCKHGLLNKNEEVVLGREIQKLIKYEEKRDVLQEKLMRPPTYSEWATAIAEDMTVTALKRQLRRSLRAKKALTESNVRLVVSLAKKFQNCGLTMQDLCQEGILGLTRACEKYDPELGFRFSTYATWWIRQSMHRAVTDQSRTIRLPAHIHEQLYRLREHRKDLTKELGREPTNKEAAERMGIKEDRVEFLLKSSRAAISMETEIGGAKKGSGAGVGGEGDSLTIGDMVKDPNQSPDDETSFQMFREDLSRLLCTLAPREQAVIRMRYGLDDGKPKTLEHIGDRFSVSRERVRQIEARALHKLRQPYRNHNLRCYVGEMV